MSVFLYNDDGSLMILPGSYEDPGSIILVHITSSPSGCLHTFGRRTMENTHEKHQKDHPKAVVKLKTWATCRRKIFKGEINTKSDSGWIVLPASTLGSRSKNQS